MNDRAGNHTDSRGKRGGGRNSGGAAIASVQRIDGHDGYHGRGWWCDVGAGKQARMDRNDAGLFCRWINGGGLWGDGTAYYDMVDRDRIPSGGAQRSSLGLMRFFPWLGARLGCGETTEGFGVMDSAAPYIRFAILAAVVFVGMQWLLSDWMQSIEARLWLYEHLSGWRR